MAASATWATWARARHDATAAGAGWGNRSRGDDALGPLCVERLRDAMAQREDIEFLDDYQLMVEHVLDLHGRTRVLLVDASLAARRPSRRCRCAQRPMAA